MSIQSPSSIPLGWKYFLGGAAGVTAWVPVHPFSVISVRKQLYRGSGNPGLISVVKQMFRNEGLFSIYNGLSAALLRQATYGTLRVGIYTQMDQFLTDYLSNTGESNALIRAASGLFAGASASFLTCPIEVCLVRLQADGRLPAAARRNYTSLFNAFQRVAQEEGPITFWRGATPTIARAMVVNLTQLASYDQAKAMYTKYLHLDEGLSLHLLSSTTAGLIYSLASFPLEKAKSRMQDQIRNVDGSLPYPSVCRTISTIIRKEKLSSLYRGYVPYFLRCGGHSVFLFVILEQYRKMYWRYTAPSLPAPKA